MKRILLVPDEPFYNYVDIAVMDFPKGEEEPPRQRCKVTADLGPYDVKQLKMRGLDLDGAMEYYRQHLYDVVRFHISQDWECVGGMDKVMDIIEKHIRTYYQ